MAFELKEFLKPSRNKCAAAALLFILFVPFITYWNGTMCIQAPCPSESAGSMLLFLFSGPRHIYSLNFPVAMLGLALSYAFACALLGWKKGKGQ
ncbi:MAG: hypothetical protein WC861_05610 [Candidatus Micrarchaeia archaeon]|jgi:hypothetical protein